MEAQLDHLRIEADQRHMRELRDADQVGGQPAALPAARHPAQQDVRLDQAEGDLVAVLVDPERDRAVRRPGVHRVVDDDTERIHPVLHRDPSGQSVLDGTP